MQLDGERFLKDEITHIKAAVIGDMMTDRYITGKVNRISPEAPVPVNLVQSQRDVLGGAANTAANLAALFAPAIALKVDPDAPLQIDTGGGNDADVDMFRFVTAHWNKALVFQHIENFYLHLRR